MSGTPSRLVIMGPPGSGKGTQGKALAARLGITHISTGDILRAEIASGSRVGLAAGKLIDNGEYVPDDMITAIVLDAIARPPADAGYLLDGYPRTLVQARTLASIPGAVDAVILLDVPDSEIVERILRRASEGRVDDTPDTLATRLRIYRERTAPIAGFFEDQGLLRPVDGSGPQEDVTEAILQRLAPATGPGAP